MIEEAMAAAYGLAEEDARTVRALVRTWRLKKPRNDLRDAYYRGHIRPKRLGVAVHPKVKVAVSCGWPRKAVDYLACRSILEGFTVADDETDRQIREIMADNMLQESYLDAVTSELIHCCTFLTVTASPENKYRPIIRAIPATAASALWDDTARRISAGLVVVDMERDPSTGRTEATEADVFTDTHVIQLKKRDGAWFAEYGESSMGRVLMEPMANRPTLMLPFGRSVISRSVMQLADAHMRQSERAEVAAEFAAAPQKYLLGVTREMRESISAYDAYIGSLFAVSVNDEGNIPQFGQLPQPSMAPHIEYMRSLALQASSETDVPASAMGVVTENPTSADAIGATKADAVLRVQQINQRNGHALESVMLMALAIANGTDYAAMRAEHPELRAHFTDPALPSIVGPSDAMCKQIAAIPWIGETDVALEKMGYTNEQVYRMKSQRDRAAALATMRGALEFGEDG